MPKINPSLLPVVPREIRHVTAPVPGQGDFAIYLRQPDFGELLKISEATTAKVVEWEKRQDWYPCDPPVAVSVGLWNVAVPSLLLQCSETGDELSNEERYYEQELVPILGRLPTVYFALNAAIGALLNAAQGEQGNDSEAGAESPSALASTTDNSTLT